jgi:hypothetical protein
LVKTSRRKKVTNRMDVEQLRSKVETLRAKVHGAAPQKWYVAYHSLDELGETSDLKAFLQDQPEVREFNGQMRTVGDSASTVSYSDLAHWLVQRALETDTDTAIEELTRYLQNPEFECTFLIALAGVSVTRAVELGAGIQLIPFSKTKFLQEERHDSPSYELVSSISAALCITVEHPKRYHPPSTPIDQECRSKAAEYFSQLQEARLCLGIVKPSPSLEVGRTVYLPSCIPLAGPFSSMSYSVQVLVPDEWTFSEPELHEAKRIYESFRCLDASLRRRLYVPMARLQKSMINRFPTVDGLIDLGIAMEATFLTDDEQDELTFRLAVRGARLLGRDERERKQLKDLLSALYKARSVAVHRGTLPDRVPRPSQHATLKDLFDHGCATTARAIREIITRGNIDWEAIVLA